MGLLRPIIAAIVGCGIAAGLIVATASTSPTTTAPVETVVPSPTSTEAVPIDSSSSTSTTLQSDVACDEGWEALAVVLPNESALSNMNTLQLRLGDSARVRWVVDPSQLCQGLHVLRLGDASTATEIEPSDDRTWLYVVLPRDDGGSAFQQVEQQVQDFANSVMLKVDRWTYEVAESAASDGDSDEGGN